MTNTGNTGTSKEGEEYVTKQVFVDALKELTTEMNRQFAAILEAQSKVLPPAPAVAPTVPAAPAAPTDTVEASGSQGKRVVFQGDHGDYYEPADFEEDDDELRGILGKKFDQALQNSSPWRQPDLPRYSSAPPQLKASAEPVFSEDYLKKLIQGEVEAARSGIKGYSGFSGLDLDSFSIVPGIELPENFKTPKFTLYDGNGNAQEHLMMYCKKMAPYAGRDDLMIYSFQESLTGPAMKWYGGLGKAHTQTWRGLAEAFVRHYAFNERLAITKEDLGKMGQKSQESIREYAKRWMLAADQVQPALSGEEAADVFMNTLKPELREKLVSHVDYDIFQMVKAVERMEKESSGNKSSVASQDRKNFKKNESSVNALSGPSNQQNRFQPRNNNSNPRPPAQIPGYNPTPPAVYQPNFRPSAPQQSESIQIDTQYRQVPPTVALQGNNAPQRPYKAPRKFDAIPISYANLLQQLLNKGKIRLAPALLNPRTDGRYYNPNLNCVFHMGQVGHDVENCYPLKCEVQDLIDANKLKFEQPNIARNPLPNHGGPTINAIFETKGIIEKDDNGPALPPHSSGEKSLANWVLRGQPEKLLTE